ncbi:MAG: energy transducer TonB [Phenylobacterium sp.]|nr:energy transducer TonB [Phenylobacterium sp.]
MHHRRKWAVAALLAGLWGAGAASAQTEGSAWVSRASEADRGAVLARAVATGAFARAVAKCGVADDGALVGCRLVDETPSDIGLGEAFLDLTPKYRRKPPGPDDPREITLTLSWSPADTRPETIRRWTPAQLTEVFPVEAYRKGIDGRATISCVLTEQAVMTQCVVLEESPPGSGFGGATIALTPQMQMRPATQDGKPVRHEVAYTVGFAMGGSGSRGIRQTRRRIIPASLTWAEAPDFAAVAAAMPAAASDKSGRVVLLCDMTGEGRLEDCDVAQADPKGQGFETAAQALAGRFMLPLGTEAERKAATNLRVQLPITFDPARVDPARPVVEKPLWAALPDANRLQSTFGPLATTAPIRAALACRIEAGGALADCSVASEQPAGVGVGTAAMSLAPAYRVSTWSNEGLPVVGGLVTVLIRYDRPR